MKYQTKNFKSEYLLRVSFFLFLGIGSTSCGEDTAEKEEGADCTLQSDCGGGTVCLELDSTRTCAPTCTVSASECGGSASCTGTGGASIDVCQPPRTPEEKQDPKKQPRLPCESDTECAAQNPGSICVQWKGSKECTIPCDRESECTISNVGQVTIDFLTCIEDEADSSRKACVPDEACFQNPTSCITFPGSDGVPGL